MEIAVTVDAPQDVHEAVDGQNESTIKLDMDLLDLRFRPLARPLYR
jgi:hypothetical protein